jgi:hypothetical protein
MINHNIKISLLVGIFLLPVSYALASTTISTDITTGGTLTVGSTTATSTFSNSINLLNGCFSINGTCLSSGSATTPGGASSTVQFNANGSFGGNSNFTFDGTTATLNNLTVNGSAIFNGALSADIIPLQDTAANLSTVVASSGQMVYETDTKYSKAGDGVTALGSIPPIGFWKNNGSNISYSNGKVGIGTTSPVSMLSVGGDITATGTLYMTGSNITGSTPQIDLSNAPDATILLNTNEDAPSQIDYYDGYSLDITAGNSDDGLNFTNMNLSAAGSIYLNSSSLTTHITNGGLSIEGLNKVSAPSNGLYVAGKVGIGSSTPAASLQVTNTAANATTTVEIGKSGQNKGSCLKLYRSDGSAIYASVSAGATTFTLSTTACATVTGF